MFFVPGLLIVAGSYLVGAGSVKKDDTKVLVVPQGNPCQCGCGHVVKAVEVK